MNATIELQEILITAGVLIAPAILVMLYRHRERIIAILKTVVVLSCIAGIATGAYWYAPEPQIIEKIVKVAVPVKMEKKSAMHYAKMEANKRGIPHLILDVIEQKESSTGKMNAIRYEAHHLVKYCGKYKLGSEEQRMCSSSHGAFQIMGWHAYAEGKTYANLYDAEYNGTKAVEIIDKCRSKHVQVVSKYEHYSKVFECYNGSSVYAADAMNILSRKVVESAL